MQVTTAGPSMEQSSLIRVLYISVNQWISWQALTSMPTWEYGWQWCIKNGACATKQIPEWLIIFGLGIVFLQACL